MEDDQDVDSASMGSSGDEESDELMDSSAPRSGNQAKKAKRTQKQKIRDIRRLLKREDLPATVRQTQERMLALLQGEVKETDVRKRAKKMAKKYKMVKFFDRRKVSRKLKATNRRACTVKDEVEKRKLLESIEELKKDYNYAVHFPLDKKYISLFSTPCGKERDKQQEIRDVINDLVVSGQFDDTSMEVIEGRRGSKKDKRQGYVTLGIRKETKDLSLKKHEEDSANDDDNDHFKDDFFL
eukprot:m.310272 g.310272  ORF g.310272 m.310272 type:complete len:240 (+) comp50580_c0_seq1:33-752(+)